MIFGECDNSSLTHLGKHKKFNIVRQMAPQRLGIFALVTSLILLTYFTYLHRPIILCFYELK